MTEFTFFSSPFTSNSTEKNSYIILAKRISNNSSLKYVCLCIHEENTFSTYLCRWLGPNLGTPLAFSWKVWKYHQNLTVFQRSIKSIRRRLYMDSNMFLKDLGMRILPSHKGGMRVRKMLKITDKTKYGSHYWKIVPYNKGNQARRTSITIF